MIADTLRSAGLLVPVLFLFVSGCDRAPEGSPVAVRDSAGVEIVANARPVWVDGGEWTVGSGEILRLGVVDGDPAYQFSMVAGAVRLVGGGIAVADAGSQQVRFFGPDGAHRATTGGTGAGPGEFTGLTALGPAPDGGVWAYDLPLRRLTWLAPDGEVVRLATLPPEPAMLNAVGALPDGSMVLKQLWGAGAVAGAAETGLRRDRVAYVRFDREAISIDTVGLFPGREVYIGEEGGRGVMMTPSFPHNAVGAVRADRIVVGSQTRFELEEYAPDGRLLRRIRLPSGELAVTSADVDDYIDRYVRAVEPERRPALRAMLEGMPAPATRPAYGAVLADRTGHTWVAEWTVFPELPSRWTVLDPKGRWLGEVAVPGDLELLDIGPDWLVGVETDEVDVEYVVVYPLDRGPGGSGVGTREE